MSLSAKQAHFTRMIALLVQYADLLGYSLTYSNAYRSPEQAQKNADSGVGIANSLHTKRLAVDFNLFIDGDFKTTTDDHKPLGEFWEFIGGTWGGRFNDGNHYSLEHNGIK